MDLKKIKPVDLLGFLDNIIAKIPDSIQKIIKNVFTIIYKETTVNFIFI